MKTQTSPTEQLALDQRVLLELREMLDAECTRVRTETIEGRKPFGPQGASLKELVKAAICQLLADEEYYLQLCQINARLLEPTDTLAYAETMLASYIHAYEMMLSSYPGIIESCNSLIARVIWEQERNGVMRGVEFAKRLLTVLRDRREAGSG